MANVGKGLNLSKQNYKIIAALVAALYSNRHPRRGQPLPYSLSQGRLPLE